MRGVVAERPVVPRGRLELAAIGVIAAATREVTLNISSPTGGGERIWGGWRFWPHRMRVAGGMEAPSPWGGVWAVDAATETQPFTDVSVPAAERVSAYLRFADWVTGRVRLMANAGVDDWKDGGLRPSLAGGLRFVTSSERVAVDAGASVWPMRGAFSTTSASVAYRSSTSRGGLVWTMTGHAAAATVRTPLDLWSAGDTGHARRTLLRAHPLLDEGRLRIDRLGRSLAQGSSEVQYWRPVRGVVQAGVALFGDLARTSDRFAEAPRTDVDLGFGARLAVAGLPGVVRVDVARGLRDAAHALSVAYEP